MSQYDIGLIGLAVMGQNLVLNIENRGFSVAVYNRTAERTQEFIQKRAQGKNISGLRLAGGDGRRPVAAAQDHAHGTGR